MIEGAVARRLMINSNVNLTHMLIAGLGRSGGKEEG